MEENQMPKKRNYERYLEGEQWTPPQGTEHSVPEQNKSQYTMPQDYMSQDYSGTMQPSSNVDGLEEPVTKGEWALCYLLMMIPCVGIVLMFVWAFSKTEKKSKSNFFKVQLIIMGIVFVLYFLFFLLVLFMGVSMA